MDDQVTVGVDELSVALQAARLWAAQLRTNASVARRNGNEERAAMCDQSAVQVEQAVNRCYEQAYSRV